MATILKRNNAYQIRVSCGYDSHKQQIIKTMTWKPEGVMTEKQAEKEAQRQAVLFEEKCRSGQVLDGSIKFEEFAEFWMTEYAEKNLRPTTIPGYKHMLKRINKAVGHIRLDKLQPNHLMEFYNMLQVDDIQKPQKYAVCIDAEKLLSSLSLSHNGLARSSGVSATVINSMVKGVNISEESACKLAATLKLPLEVMFKKVGDERKISGKTALHHHRLLSSILEKAVKWQIIYSNPCDRVEAPKAPRKEARYLDEKQTAKLLECLQREDLEHRTMITLFLYTGMRRGELCGLEWKDIDFINGLIDINKSSLYLADKGVFQDDTKFIKACY